MYNGPIRGGSRGGRDQFNWESVKGDKDREFYIGHSVKASVGRWQKGKDILWYTRAKGDNGNSLMDERKAVKDREEDLMLEALGIKKKVKKQVGPNSKLEGYELEELLRKGSGEDGSQQNVEDEEKVKGLGFKPGNFGGVAVQEVLEGLDDGGELAQRRRMMVRQNLTTTKDEEAKDAMKGLESKHVKPKKEKKKDKKSKDKHKKRRKDKERGTEGESRRKSQKNNLKHLEDGVTQYRRNFDGKERPCSSYDKDFPEKPKRKVQDTHRKEIDEWHSEEPRSKYGSNSRRNPRREPGHEREMGSKQSGRKRVREKYQDISDDSWEKGVRRS